MTLLRNALSISVLTVVACGGADPVPPPPPGAPTVLPPPPHAPLPSLTGIWLGTLQAGGKALRLQLHLDLAQSPPTCSLDSLDQNQKGIPCGNVAIAGSAVSLDVAAVHGGFKGTTSADSNTVTGKWTQGPATLDLVLIRQTVALEPAAPSMDAARPALDADLDKLKAVLDDDLTDMLARGDLAPASGNGAAIGVVAHGVRKIFVYGSAKPDSVFDIGSISKTFTGLMLAQMVEQQKVKLADPVRALMPKGNALAPTAGPEITLLDLSAQRSGLPRLPPNLAVKDTVNPYADYDAKMLYAAVETHGVALPAKPELAYSNFGVGLLGQLLADRSGSTYEALLTKEITRPLGMHDTAIVLSPAQQKRLLPGHDAKHNIVPAWQFKALAGAGAIRSTAADMLTYLEAELHPDHLPKTAAASREGKTLRAALMASQTVQGEAGEGQHIALNWFRIDKTGSYWHNGATGGFSSYAQFNVDRDYAVVVLTNTTISNHSFADDLGKHVVQRLTGKAALTLAPPAP